MKKIIVAVTLIINSGIIFYGCKKDKIIDTPTEFESQTSQDNSLADQTFTDVNNIVNEALERGDSGLVTYRVRDGLSHYLSGCATVTVHPAVPPGPGGTVTVNFGTSLCLCADGRYRKGIINIAYTANYRDSGTVITTTFNNYYTGKDSTNIFLVTGTKTVTNKGHNGNGNINFDISVDGHLTDKNGITMDWTSARNREWVAGFATRYNWTDDQYKITGTAHGTNFEGNSFDVVITIPLLIKLTCPFITQGAFNLTPSGKAVRTFDYGNGVCDATATLTVNGKVITFTLR